MIQKQEENYKVILNDSFVMFQKHNGGRIYRIEDYLPKYFMTNELLITRIKKLKKINEII
jgi:hypothetical protein